MPATTKTFIGGYTWNRFNPHNLDPDTNIDFDWKNDEIEKLHQINKQAINFKPNIDDFVRLKTEYMKKLHKRNKNLQIKTKELEDLHNINSKVDTLR